MWTNGYIGGSQVNMQVSLVNDIPDDAWEPTSNPAVQFVELTNVVPDAMEIVTEKVKYPAIIDKNGVEVFPASVKPVKVLKIDVNEIPEFSIS